MFKGKDQAKALLHYPEAFAPKPMKFFIYVQARGEWHLILSLHWSVIFIQSLCSQAKLVVGNAPRERKAFLIGPRGGVTSYHKAFLGQDKFPRKEKSQMRLLLVQTLNSVSTQRSTALYCRTIDILDLEISSTLIHSYRMPPWQEGIYDEEYPPFLQTYNKIPYLIWES